MKTTLGIVIAALLIAAVAHVVWLKTCRLRLQGGPGLSTCSAVPVPPAVYPVPAVWYSLTNVLRGDGLPVLDTPTMLLCDGADAVAQSAPDTLAWAADHPMLLLVLDINAPGLEDPVYGDDDWYSCGILLRNCTYRGGRVVARNGFSLADMNVIDATPRGLPDVTTGDFAGPRDEYLPANLAPTLDAIKASLLALLQPPAPATK